MSTPGEQQVHTFSTTFPSGTINTRYLLYLPRAYDAQPEKRWPFILFLHGAGERGNNPALVASQGLPKLLRDQRDFPFIVLSPQCVSGSYWHTDTLATMLAEAMGEYRIDTERIYLTGLSLGGFGTWAMAIAHPQRFAAIAPICGGGDPNAVCRIKHVPVWTFHGARDTIVPIESTERMVDALKKCGGQVLFTVYPEAGHDSWTQTYANQQLYDWFLQWRRSEAHLSS